MLAALFRTLPPAMVERWVRDEPTGQHARRARFLYEWLTGRRLDLPDATRGPYVGVLDPDRQFAIGGSTVSRHRVRDNLPGTPEFCPLVRCTERLATLLSPDPAAEARAVVQRAAPDLVARAAAFLLLEDSRASYVIEGERPGRTACSAGAGRSAKLGGDRWTRRSCSACNAS